MTKIVQMLEVLAHDFHNKKRRFPNYFGSTTNLEISDNCWIFEVEFSKTNAKVLDQNYFDGSFPGWAGSQQLQHPETYHIFHPYLCSQSSKNRLHHVLKRLQDTNIRNTFLVIPLNEEKFISLTMKVWIRSYINEKRNVCNI